MSSNSSVGTSTTTSLSTQASNKFNNNNNKKTIFLSVAPITTESQLYGYLIEQASSDTKAIRDVRIPTDKDGKSRCFAFITFNWHKDAEKAMEDLEGRPLDGLIRPRWATSRKTCKNNNQKQQQKNKRSDNRQHQQKQHQQRNGKNILKGKKIQKT